MFFSFKGSRLGHAQAWGQRRCGVPQEAPEGESAHAEEASASWRRDGRHGGGGGSSKPWQPRQTKRRRKSQGRSLALPPFRCWSEDVPELVDPSLVGVEGCGPVLVSHVED